MPKVSVRLDPPSPYLESDSWLYKTKRRLTYQYAIRAIRRYAFKSDDMALLEIGTGAGFFLSTFHSYWPQAKITGLEYDTRLLEATQARAPFANCIQGNAESFHFQDTQFDIIVSFQVIEHLFDPEAMLANVRKHLKADGIFIMTSPNLDGFGARLLKSKWHGYREDHISLKHFAEWQSVLSNAGFISLYCGSTFFSGIPLLNRFPLGVINWLMLAVFGHAPWKYGESFIGVFKSSAPTPTVGPVLHGRS